MGSNPLGCQYFSK